MTIDRFWAATRPLKLQKLQYCFVQFRPKLRIIMKETEDSFGEQLRKARKKASLTQEEAASLLDVSKRTLGNWEDDKHMPRDKSPEAVLSKLRSRTENRRDPIYRLTTHSEEGKCQISKRPIGHVKGKEALSRPGREIFWVFIGGDAMNRRYRKQSLVPVLKFQSETTDIQEDDVYLVRLENAVQLKRLQRLPNQRIRVISDNEAYPNTVLQIDQDVDFEVLGRVLV